MLFVTYIPHSSVLHRFDSPTRSPAPSH